jgi:hypothetical protein
MCCAQEPSKNGASGEMGNWSILHYVRVAVVVDSGIRDRATLLPTPSLGGPIHSPTRRPLQIAYFRCCRGSREGGFGTARVRTGEGGRETDSRSRQTNGRNIYVSNIAV